MATARACRQLVGVLPDLARARRSLLGPAESASTVLLLSAVEQLGSPRASDVASHLDLDTSTVSRHLSTLRASGLLRSAPDPSDGRSHRVELTDQGAAELERRRASLTDRLVDHLAPWEDDEVTELVGLLDRFLDSTTATRRGPVPGSAPEN